MSFQYISCLILSHGERYLVVRARLDFCFEIDIISLSSSYMYLMDLLNGFFMSNYWVYHVIVYYIAHEIVDSYKCTYGLTN